ncbi:hypothetical protein DK853_46325, partial [Klebsiella oxytoca]
YYNWGLEDEDIHWKMKTLTKSKEIYNVCSSLKMLHFEHKKNMNNLIYKKNREVYDERLRDGVEKSLENDLDNIK